MKDAIDKRNERERIASSIVKRWNVVYITKEELERRRQEEERQEQKEEERRKADEILRRLEREAQEDEFKKEEELRALYAQVEAGSHTSNIHGTVPMDGVTQEKVEAILSDKDRMLQQIIRDTGAALQNQKLEEGVGTQSQEDNTAADADIEAEMPENESEDVKEAEEV